MNKNQTKKKYSICFIAGCSGGHIIPCLTRAQQEQQLDPQTEVLFFSTNRTLDKKIIAESPIAKTHIPLPLTAASYGMKKLPVSVWHLAQSFFISLYHLQKKRPAFIFTTGSHIAIPACLAAWVLRIPVHLFEVNVTPGKTIKLLTPFAQKIFICYKKTGTLLPQKKCELTAYPIKPSLYEKISSEQAVHKLFPQTEADAHNRNTREENNHALLTARHKKTILILGGSQGSLSLNTTLKNILESDPAQAEKLSTQIQVIHQTGAQDTTDWRAYYAQKKIPAHVFAYDDLMAPYYAAADLTIARAGAGTIAELLFFEKKTILIPLETTTNNHQLDNARAAAQEYPELITVIRQKNAHAKGMAILEMLRAS